MSYECDSCTRCFHTAAACNQHMNDTGHHLYECDSCTRNFRTPHARDQHMTAINHWIYSYECETCDARFSSDYACDAHMDDEDHWSYPYQCETCTLAFRAEDDLDEHQQDEGHYEQLYCKSCDRYFQSANNKDQHMKSRVHQGSTLPCPFCQKTFTTASGVSHHIETGSCPIARQLDRAAVHRILGQRDPKGFITERLIGWHDSSLSAEWDPNSAWNGQGYDCYICHRSFSTPHGLRQHITSPVHQAPLYHCPNQGGSCGGRRFLTLAALFNHLESETCSFIKFAAVKRQATALFTGQSSRLLTSG